MILIGRQFIWLILLEEVGIESDAPRVADLFLLDDLPLAAPRKPGEQGAFRSAKADPNKVPLWLEDTDKLIEGLCDVRAHPVLVLLRLVCEERVDGGLVHDDVEGLVGVSHLADVLHLPRDLLCDFWCEVLACPLLHHADDRLGAVDAEEIFPLSVARHALCQLRVAAARDEGAPFLAGAYPLFEDGSHFCVVCKPVERLLVLARGVVHVAVFPVLWGRHLGGQGVSLLDLGGEVGDLLGDALLEVLVLEEGLEDCEGFWRELCVVFVVTAAAAVTHFRPVCLI